MNCIGQTMMKPVTQCTVADFPMSARIYLQISNNLITCSQSNMLNSYKWPSEIRACTSWRMHRTSRLNSCTTVFRYFMTLLNNTWFRINKTQSVLTSLNHSIYHEKISRGGDYGTLHLEGRRTSHYSFIVRPIILRVLSRPSNFNTILQQRWKFRNLSRFLTVIAYVSSRVTRNSSGDEIANVNFLCDDIVHALKIQ